MLRQDSIARQSSSESDAAVRLFTPQQSEVKQIDMATGPVHQAEFQGPLSSHVYNQHEQEQLEGFVMMYELVRPLCRTSVQQEFALEQKRSNLNLKSQNMLLTLLQA